LSQRFAVVGCNTAAAASAGKYAWYGWRMTPTDYAIVHAKPHDPTESDFYLVCKGAAGGIGLNVRALNGRGYKSESVTDVPTNFVFPQRHYPATAGLLGPGEMLGGVAVLYSFARDDPIGEPFRVVLPKPGRDCSHPGRQSGSSSR
jgi:hypothetical protein